MISGKFSDPAYLRLYVDSRIKGGGMELSFLVGRNKETANSFIRAFFKELYPAAQAVLSQIDPSSDDIDSMCERAYELEKITKCLKLCLYGYSSSDLYDLDEELKYIDYGTPALSAAIIAALLAVHQIGLAQ